MPHLGFVTLLPRDGFETAKCWLRRLDAGFAALLACFGLLAGTYFWAQAYCTKHDVAPYVEELPDSVRPLAKWCAGWLRADSSIVHRERNFFGTFTVNNYGRYYLFNHGTTTHGAQDRKNPAEPLTYFCRTGAIGQLFESVEGKCAGRSLRVAVLGVGTGTLAAYMRPGWEMTLFEIDPAVVRVARDPKYFSFLSDAEERGVKINVLLGDGRLQLRDAPDAAFDLLFMDAFTSDAVPVHLLTREALQIYLRKLAPGGLLIVNIANRYLSLNPALGNLAADLGLEGRAQSGYGDYDLMKFASAWVVLARREEDFGDLLSKKDGNDSWEPLQRDAKVGVWTDDYSNLLRVFQWQR
jgi:SAM-dependent methyltransferase